MSPIDIFVSGVLTGLAFAACFAFFVAIQEQKKSILKLKIEIDTKEATKRLKEMEIEISKFKKEMNL